MRSITSLLTAFALMSLIFIAACNPKTGQKLSKAEQAKADAFKAAQDSVELSADALIGSEQGKWGPDSNATVTNYSLYREYCKQDLYDDAIPYWRYVIKNAPEARKTPYVDGMKMYRAYADKAGDAATKQAYIDTLFDLYEKRQAIFGEEGYLAGRKAKDMKRFFPEDKKAYYALVNKSLEIQQEESENHILLPYFSQKYTAYQKREISYDDFLDTYSNLTDIVDHNIANDHPKKDKYIKVKEKIDKTEQKVAQKLADRTAERARKHQEAVEEAKKAQKEYEEKIVEYQRQLKEYEDWMKAQKEDSVAYAQAVAEYKNRKDAYEQWEKAKPVEVVAVAPETIVPNTASSGLSLGSCSEVKSHFDPKYQSNSSDVKTVKRYYYYLNKNGCKSDPIFEQLAFKLYELEPTPKRARRAGQKYYNKGDYSKAIQCFEKAISLESDRTMQSKIYMNMAYAERKKSNNLTNSNAQNARKYAKKAAELNPGWGKPFMFIGDLYASSGKLCGPGTGWDSQVVAWAACDMWSKAASVDPSIAADAKKSINKYSQYFPLKSEGFMKSIKQGQSYRIGCWIGTSTRARFRAD